MTGDDVLRWIKEMARPHNAWFVDRSVEVQLVRLIDEAIMKERARCLKIAQVEADMFGQDNPHTQQCLQTVLAAIESGDV